MANTRITVMGAAGRMGRNLVRAIAETPDAELAAGVEREGSPHVGADCGVLAGLEANGVIVGTSIADALQDVDAVLDFTAPEATVVLAESAAARGVAHIIGTTGLSAEQDEAIAQAARKTAIMKSGNMSMGVILLSVLVEQAAKALDAAGWDIEVLEMHHRHKVDAPSGTALLLGEAAARGRGIGLANSSVRARDGHTGPRPEGAIGFATMRGGSVVGDHSVMLAGPGERVTLAHHAEDRMIFARGAVKAALWTHGRAPGLYSMYDVLGLARTG